MHAEDNLAVAQNGGSSGREDDSDTGGDTDESMDDDMMDKISSSPSIEDGGCALLSPRDWPRRVDSLPSIRDRGSPLSTPSPSTTPSPTLAEPPSSSPYMETPDSLPYQSEHNPDRQHHHLRGEYHG